MGIVAHVVAAVLLLGAGFVVGAIGGAAWMRDELGKQSAALGVALSELTAAVVGCMAMARSGDRAALDRAGDLLEDAVKSAVRALGEWR